MKPKSIEEMWEEYSAIAGLAAPDVTPERREEARHTYIAGMLEMFIALSKVATLTEEEAEATVDAWNEEFTKYATDLAEKISTKHGQSR
jgi:hypothetical protein